MGDPLRQAIAEVVRDMLPANDLRQWRRIEAEAVARGFKSTRAFREWCLARGVPVREDNHKDTWVDVAGIDAAVERMPAVRPRPSATPKRDVLDDEIDARNRPSR